MSVMRVIISYQEKAKLTLSGNIQRKQTKRHFYRPGNFKTFRPGTLVLCQTAGPMYISYYLIPTHKININPFIYTANILEYSGNHLLSGKT